MVIKGNITDDKKDAYIQAFEILTEFERKAEPFRFYYKDFPVWLALRQSIYLLIVKNLSPTQNINCGSISRRERIWTYIPLIVSGAKFLDRSLIFNLKKIRKKYVLCSTDIARKTINKEEMNIFIDPIRIFDTDNMAVGLEFISNKSYKKNEIFYTLRAYDLFLLRAVSFVLKPCVCGASKKPFSFDRRMACELRKIGIGIGTLRYLTCSFISDFEFVTRYWEYVFKKTHPKLIASIDWYSVGNMLMIFIANKSGIPTVELTHGLINPQHQGYIFKNLEKNQRLKLVFPNYIICYGKFHKNIMITEGTFWEKNNIFDLGFPFMDYFLNNIKVDKNKKRNELDIRGDRNILVITSQEPFQSALKNMLSSLNIPDNWYVIVKLHPGEILSWKKAYGDLTDKSRLKFVTDETINIYELLTISTAHASFYSSVLWEAPAFDISNYIIDYSTKYMVKELEELGLAKVSSIQDIFYDNHKPNKESVKYVFSNLDGSSSQKISSLFKSISNI